MRKELSFISNCFNINYQVKSKKILEDLINKDLDWDFILKKIIQSDIAPLAFYNLSGFENTKIPAWFMENLKNRRDSAIVKNLFLWRELNRLIGLLSQENISALALKGVFMSDIIYQTIDVRPLVDIDILIKKSDLEKAQALLQKNGYVKSDEYPAEILYIPNRAQPKILIDLHHALNIPDELLLPKNFMWLRAEKKENSASEILYPSIEDSIICAALHFFHHISDAFLYNSPPSHIKSILDIHEIISKKQNEINWNYILEFSKKYKVRYILHLSLTFSKIYFNTPIPAKVINEIKPSFIRDKILHIFIKKYALIQPDYFHVYTKDSRFLLLRKHMQHKRIKVFSLLSLKIITFLTFLMLRGRLLFFLAFFFIRRRKEKC